MLGYEDWYNWYELTFFVCVDCVVVVISLLLDLSIGVYVGMGCVVKWAFPGCGSMRRRPETLIYDFCGLDLGMCLDGVD